MATKIYVCGLASETTEQELEDLFRLHGEVSSVHIILDSKGGESKGFGFVEMLSAEEAQKAITRVHGKDFGGRKLSVNQARLRQEGLYEKDFTDPSRAGYGSSSRGSYRS